MVACGDAATLVLATDLARVLLGRIEDLHRQNPTDLGVQLRGFWRAFPRLFRNLLRSLSLTPLRRRDGPGYSAVRLWVDEFCAGMSGWEALVAEIQGWEGDVQLKGQCWSSYTQHGLEQPVHCRWCTVAIFLQQCEYGRQLLCRNEWLRGTGRCDAGLERCCVVQLTWACRTSFVKAPLSWTASTLPVVYSRHIV